MTLPDTELLDMALQSMSSLKKALQTLVPAMRRFPLFLGPLRLDFAGHCPACNGRVFRTRTKDPSRRRSKYLGFICGSCGRKLFRREVLS